MICSYLPRCLRGLCQCWHWWEGLSLPWHSPESFQKRRVSPEGIHEPNCSLSTVSTVSLSELMPPPLGPKLITAVFLLLSAKRSNFSLKGIDGHHVCHSCHWVHKAYTNSLVSHNVPFSFLFFSIPFLSPCSPHSHISCPRHHIQVSRSHRKVLSREGKVEQLRKTLGTADGKSICLTLVGVFAKWKQTCSEPSFSALALSEIAKININGRANVSVLREKEKNKKERKGRKRTRKKDTVKRTTLPLWFN